MRTIRLQCSNRSELHDLLEKELPSPYGRNLDALHDILSTLSEELVLELEETALCAALGDRYFDNLLRMLRETSLENPKFQIRLK